MIDFSAAAAKGIYSNRKASARWLNWAESSLSPKDKVVADIACGGGIYTRAFADLGAKEIIGVDSSEQYIEQARAESASYQSLHYLCEDACHTKLNNNYFDVVYERALIHHFSTPQMIENAKEAFRILRSDGLFIVQDRTIDDVLKQEPGYWIRSALFECYPRLLEFEQKRRLTTEAYTQFLLATGFDIKEVVALDEVRKTYDKFENLEQEIMSRKGKSILFQLNDQELAHYCSQLKIKAQDHRLVEIDPWTIWIAKKVS